MGETLQPLFILTCMRSFSSVVSSMLGQHAQLFVMPETNLFISDTLGESVALLSEIRPRSLDGLYRLVGELEFGGQSYDTVNEAKTWIDARRNLTPVDLMTWVSDKVAPRRVIEKSPSTVLARGRIDLAIDYFPQAHFLHLYRHPVTSCASIARVTNYQDTGVAQKGFAKDPELSWLEANARIVDAANRIPSGKFMSARGEDVLNDPERFVGQLGTWLDLETTPEDIDAIYHPERSPFACYGPRNAPFGSDPNFLSDPFYTKREIVTPPLSSELLWAKQGRHLRRETRLLSYQLGYGDSACSAG